MIIKMISPYDTRVPGMRLGSNMVLINFSDAKVPAFKSLK